MSFWQWLAVLVVFAGLTLTATDSLTLGKDVAKGSFLVMIGSAMHALTYVMSEAIMTLGDDKLSIFQNTGIQGTVAAVAFIFWQLIYTLPHFETKVWEPMQVAGTSILYALILLTAFGFANLIHSITFFHTLLHFPGGATSAGVFKGLQAVLVFLFTHLLYCGKVGGPEMCFSRPKFLSLVTVCGGVLGYGYATEFFDHQQRRQYSLEESKMGNVEIEPISEKTKLVQGSHNTNA
mmetsp:Transcript_15809/g.27530  ORF Transcript_15809/g.27530 Transcript_15809/m.27530 type:complete len:235 (+) Transcript_15809:3-707(+)